MEFGKNEIRDIIIAAAVLSFAFGGVSGFVGAFIAVGISFLAHELIGHKYIAQKWFGTEAEFKMWPLGLLLAVLSSFTGIIFAAPGAVYFSPIVKKNFAFAVHRLSKREIGIIGLGGPAVNIILGTIFFLAVYLNPLIPYAGLLALAARISFFLTFFNMIPFGPLDGEKVFSWDKRVWAITMALAVAGYYFLPRILA